MKAISLIICILILNLPLRALDEKVLTSRINQVTVYTSSAQVNRESSVQLGKGTAILVVDAISPFILPATIQVKGKGEFIILDVKYRLKQPEPVIPENKPLPPAIQTRIRVLSDSLIYLGFEMDYLQQRRDMLELEKRVLANNKYMKGDLDTISQLPFAMDYFRRQMDNIHSALIKLKQEEFHLNRMRTGMEERLSALQAYNAHVNPPEPGKPKHQILITVSSQQPVTAGLQISYLVSQAGWTPAYDIRASDQLSLQLTGKAMVYQNSGEDWNNVRLRLSTITPQQGYALPRLNPYYAGHHRPINRQLSIMETAVVSTRESKAIRDEYEDAGVPAAQQAYQYTMESATLTNVEYDVDLSYSIPSNAESQVVAFLEKKLPASFCYYLTPKVDKRAYLTARIPDWNKLELLPGAANIYFDGSFVGSTQLGQGLTGDTLELALGHDRNVVMERNKDKDEVRNAVLGNNAVRTLTYSIKIKNSKSREIQVRVFDQIPLAASADIRIKPLALSEAEHDENNGLLTWKMGMSPGQSKTLSFSYTIEYDKSKPITGIY